jgi:hypothetical protein
MKGIIPCEEHFLCDSCAVDAFNAELNDMELLPAQSCKPLPRRLVEHILTSDVIEAYLAEAREYYFSRALRVHCVKKDFRRFIHIDEIDNHHAWYTIARCPCGTNTCVGCKEEWSDEHDRCLGSVESSAKPDWLPEYSEGCRIKQCPTCRMCIEAQGSMQPYDLLLLSV